MLKDRSSKQEVVIVRSCVTTVIIVTQAVVGKTQGPKTRYIKVANKEIASIQNQKI